PSDAIEVVAGQIDRPDLARSQCGELLDRGEVMQFGHALDPNPVRRKGESHRPRAPHCRGGAPGACGYDGPGPCAFGGAPYGPPGRCAARSASARRIPFFTAVRMTRYPIHSISAIVAR